MKLFVTGDTGFIGTHFQNYQSDEISSLDLALSNGRPRFNLLNTDKAFAAITSLKTTHVLHLAWSSTGSSQYEKDSSHFQWAEVTYSLVKRLSDEGIVSWVVGTGLENIEQDLDASPYGEAKLKLKSDILSLNDSCSRWISMPYVFSMYHRRPRILKSSLEGYLPRFPDHELDYLEIRDVAFQIRNIVNNSSSRISAVSSGMKIKNLVLCEQVKANRHHNVLSSCSCHPGHVYLPINSGTHFTSQLLENS